MNRKEFFECGSEPNTERSLYLRVETVANSTRVFAFHEPRHVLLGSIEFQQGLSFIKNSLSETNMNVDRFFFLLHLFQTRFPTDRIKGP